MKTPNTSLITGLCWAIASYLFIAIACTGPLLEAQELSPLERARELNAHGNAAAAISILESLIRIKSEDLDDVHRGVAWSVLGYAHQSMGRYEAAQQCYESGLKLLKPLPDAAEKYAAALENLASVEGFMHQPDAAINLNLKARRLYQQHQDYEGMARIDTWLAGIAVANNDTHGAHKHLTAAFRNAHQTTNQSDADQAAMYAVEGSLAAHEHDYSRAVIAYQRSIDSWAKSPQPEYDAVAWEHALRGDANREIGNFQEAAEDFEAALALLGPTASRAAPVYFQTELLYARLLHFTGEDAKAKRLEVDANASLEKLRAEQCSGCSVSVESLREGEAP